MLSSLSRVVNISSFYWIGTFTYAAWKRIPQDKSIPGSDRDIELSGKPLYQKDEIVIEENSPKEEKISETSVSNYSATNIAGAIFWTVIMDVPIWTLKSCYFHPNIIFMIFYAVLPNHVWFKLFPKLLAFLR